MATPILTNNSPSAGHIAWNDFVIRYESESYSVDAGSTAERWVWWRYNGGTPVIEAGAMVPSDLTDDDVVLFANKDGLGVRIQSTSLVDGELLVDGTVLANAIGADQITATHILAGSVTTEKINALAVTTEKLAASAVTVDKLAANSVTANKIAAETITGDKIAANTIAASKLIVSDMTNYAPGGDFVDATNSNWDMSSLFLARVDDVGQPPHMQGAVFPSFNTFFPNFHRFSAAAGDQFYVSMEVMTPATNVDTLTFNMAMQTYDQDNTSQGHVSAEAVPVPPNTPWTPLEGVIEITNASAFRARFSSYVSPSTTNNQKLNIRKVQLRKMGTGKLIVDGSIAGDKLMANTVTANEIDAKTITGDLFASRVVLSGLVQAGELDEETNEIISGYSELGSAGVFTVDMAGQPVASLPTAIGGQAYVKAHVELLSAEVKDNFKMHGTNNSIASEGELTLDAGVEPPTNPPTITEAWDTIQLDKNTATGPHTVAQGFNLGVFSLNPSQITSMDWNSTHNCWVVTQQRSNGFRVWRFNANGTIHNNWVTGKKWIDDWNDRQNPSVCHNSIHSQDSLLFETGGVWYIAGMTPGGNSVFNKIPSGWIIDAATRPPQLAFEAANNRYKLIQNNGGGSGTLHVRTFECVNGQNFPNANSLFANDFEAGSGMNRRVNGAVLGAQLRGGANSDWVITHDDTSTIRAFDGGTRVALNDDGSNWNWAAPSSFLAMCHNGSQFATVDAGGKITLYTNWAMGQSIPFYMYFGMSSYDSDSGGTGTHETPVGTIVRYSPKKRSKIKISVPETNDGGQPDDPDKWRVYWTSGTSEDAPTNKALYKLAAELGDPSQASSVIISADPTGAAPPGGLHGQVDAVNNFPAGTPASIESFKADLGGIPYILLKGDGAGRVGPLSWDTSGFGTIDFSKMETANDPIQLTPTLTVSAHDVWIQRISPNAVLCVGYLDVDDSNTTRRDTGMRIPEGMRPISGDIFDNSPQYGGAGNYRYIFKTDGVIEFQQDTGNNASFEGFSVMWFTA